MDRLFHLRTRIVFYYLKKKGVLSAKKTHLFLKFKRRHQKKTNPESFLFLIFKEIGEPFTYECPPRLKRRKKSPMMRALKI